MRLPRHWMMQEPHLLPPSLIKFCHNRTMHRPLLHSLFNSESEPDSDNDMDPDPRCSIIPADEHIEEPSTTTCSY